MIDAQYVIVAKMWFNMLEVETSTCYISNTRCNTCMSCKRTKSKTSSNSWHRTNMFFN